MNRTLKAVSLAATMALISIACDQKPVEGTATHAAKPAVKTTAAGGPQTVCPVMDGSPINKNIYVDHQDKRIYFCCAGCDSTFKSDPGKYLKKLAAQGVVLADAPATGAHKPSGSGSR